MFGKKEKDALTEAEKTEKELKDKISEERKKTQKLKDTLEQPAEDKKLDIIVQLRLERLKLELARTRLERIQVEQRVNDEIRKLQEERGKIKAQIPESPE